MVPTERRCPGCGIALKVTGEVLVTCPVCGTALPVPKEILDRKAEIERSARLRSLDNELFQRVGTPTTWTLREASNVIFLSYLVTALARFLLLALLVQDQGAVSFNPVLVIVLHLSMVLVGIVPLVYVKFSGMSFQKLGFKRLKKQDIASALFTGLLAGLLLYLVDVAGELLNDALFSATGWIVFGPSPVQQEFTSFMQSSPWHKLAVFAPYGASQVLGTILSIGVVLNGLLQHHEQRAPGKHVGARVKAKVIMVASAIVMLFSIALTFDPSAIFSSFGSMVVLATLFIHSRSINAPLVASLVHVIIAFALA